jgi:hypothetical protein
MDPISARDTVSSAARLVAGDKRAAAIGVKVDRNVPLGVLVHPGRNEIAGATTLGGSDIRGCRKNRYGEDCDHGSSNDT